MKKKMLALVAVFLLVGLCSSGAFALSPMGAPSAGLAQGQYDVALDYSYSKLCIEFDFSSGSGPMPDFKKDDFKVDMLTGRIGYGITDTWEGFIRVGGARARSSEDMERHTADGPAYGFGTKMTFHEGVKLKLGGLFQVMWSQLDGDASGLGWSGDMDLDMMQIQLSAGPTYQLTDDVAVFAGPFWYYLDGDKDYKEKIGAPGWREKYDIENCSDFGAHLGAHFNLCEHAIGSIEYMFTDDDSAIGASIIGRF